MRVFFKSSGQRAAISAAMMVVAILAVGAIAKSDVHLLQIVHVEILERHAPCRDLTYLALFIGFL